MTRRAIILGAGQIGLAAATRLSEQEWDVTILSRTAPASLTNLQLEKHWRQVDRDVDGALVSAIGDGADLLLDTIAFTEADAAQLLEAADCIGQFMAVSSASVYCDSAGRNLTDAAKDGFPKLPERASEAQATVAPGPENYSTNKIAMEQTLLDGAADKVCILRPCAICGPQSRHPREWWFVKRIRDDRKVIPLAFGGKSQFQTSSVENMMALLLCIAETRSTGIFNAVDPDAPSVLEIGQTIAARFGAHPEYHLIDGPPVDKLVGGTPWSVPAGFTLSDKKTRDIGYEPVGTYADCVPEALDWLGNFNGNWQAAFPQLAAYPFDHFDYALEDRYFAQIAS